MQETFAFTTNSSVAVFEDYDMSKLTTLAGFFGDVPDADLQLLACKAHEHGVRVVEGAEFPMDEIHDDEKISSWISSSLNRTLFLGLDGLNFDNEGLSGSKY